MIYLKLFLTFLKIGAFSFGGGYAMIPLIQREIENYGWLSSAQFGDIIAIAEMTPGPIAVNSATFVGYKVAGVMGGVIATTGVAIPSFVIMLLISKYFLRSKEHPLNMMIFYGIRPVIAGLIVTAAVVISETSLFKQELGIEAALRIFTNPLEVINIGSIVILIAAIIILVKYKLNPILIILGSGILGILFFYVM